MVNSRSNQIKSCTFNAANNIQIHTLMGDLASLMTKINNRGPSLPYFSRPDYIWSRKISQGPWGSLLVQHPDIHNRYYSQNTSPLYSLESSSNSEVNVDPYFVTGLTDAEGTFANIVRKNDRYRVG